MTNTNRINLSIIIPVYNVEKYIQTCLNSIFSQDAHTQSYEVIVVNDGTPDNSMSIVKQFAERHDNLFIINQENKGLSCARNAGIEIAKGDYIWVVDSDDSITKNSISQVLDVLTHYSDIEMFCFNQNEQRREVFTPTSLFTKSSYCKYYGEVHDGYFYCRKLPTGVSSRFLFSKSFLQEHGLLFTPGIYHEDQDFLIRCYTKAQRVLPLKHIWYNYNIRECGSITSTFKIKRFHDTLWIIKNFRKISKSSQDKKERTILEEGVFSLCYALLKSSYRSHREYQIFLNENKKSLKFLLLSSYFKSIRKNSIGKTYRLITSIF